MMKKITLLFFCFSLSIIYGQVPTIDFETNGADYLKGTIPANTFTIGTGVGTNTTQVAYLTNSTAQYEAYQVLLSNEVDFSTSAKTISFDFYQSESDVAARQILVKFESGDTDQYALNGYEVEITASATVGWQTLQFDFSNARASYPNTGNLSLQGSYSKMFIFIDFGATVASNTAIDNIAGGAQGVPILAPLTALNVDFETATPVASYDGAVYTDLFNNDITTGINTSAKCGQIAQINASAYANTQYPLAQGFDLSSGDKGFSMMVKGPRAVPVKFKLEGGTAKEVDANYTTPGQWQKLVFDFSSDTSTNHNLIVLFLDITAAPSTTTSDDVFLIDNIVFGPLASLANKDFSLVEVSKAYPNPTKDSWTLKTNNIKISSIQVFDILGKNVLSLKPNASEVNINASNLKTGLYFARVQTIKGVGTLKLIKN